jgi:class 3 adenylate cyclase
MDRPARASLVSLKFSLGSAFIGIAILTALLVGLANYLNVRTYARNDLREKMRSTVAVASLLVDGPTHDKLKTTADESSADYKRMKKALQAVRARYKDIRFIYTFRKRPDGKLEFVLDSESDPKEMSHVGDVYEDTTPTLDAAFEKPYQVRVEREFSTDKWGTWMSAFAPVLRSDGSLAGVIGMDMSAAKILSYERRFLAGIIAISLAVCFVVGALGLYFARFLSRPLEHLSGDMARIQALKLDGAPNLASRIEEVQHMGVALDNMKKGLRSFRRYVPAELVTELIAMQREAVLGVEKRELTVFFSDIADFTTISEQLGVERLSQQLGSYFEGMTRTILAAHGSVDKFIGDAVMAFWGAPRPLEDHAAHACRAALACQRTLDALTPQWREAGLPPMHTRIGLSTGDAVVGNMGYFERLSYTAIGDTVNLASRLESLNKFYGTKNIISEHTNDRANQAV